MLFNSVLVTEVSGSIGGITGARNGASNYLKARIKGANPRTAAQQAQKNHQSDISKSWAGLTQDERNQWIRAAKSYTKSNKLGHKGTISGFQYFMELNMCLAVTGFPAITEPPLNRDVVAVTELTSLTATALAQTISLVYAPTPTDAGTALQIWTSPFAGVGRKIAWSSMKMIGVIAPGQPSPAALGAMYTAYAGAFEAGMKIDIAVVSVNTATGARSIPLFIDTIAV